MESNNQENNVALSPIHGAKVREFTKEELAEFQELHQIFVHEKFKAEQIEKNTALIPNGQELAKQYKATTALFEGLKQNWISSKLLEMGYPKGTNVSIEMETGKIFIK